MSSQPFELVALDGRPMRLSELRLSDFLSGFSFGAGLFETLLLRRGRPLFLAEHLARLRASLARFPHAVASPVSELLTLDAVSATIATCLAQSEEMTPNFNGALKLTAADGHLLVTFRSYDAETPRRHVISYADRITYRYGDETVQHKSTSYFRQRQHGEDSVVFINERDELCETANGNLFFLRNGQLETPRVASPCLPGVIRAQVMAGRPCVERAFPASELSQVSACVMTNSLQLAAPVESLLGVSLPGSVQLATQLRALILERAGDEENPSSADESTKR